MTKSLGHGTRQLSPGSATTKCNFRLFPQPVTVLMLVTCLFPQGSIPCTSPANYICKASCKLSLASERHGGRFKDGRKRVHSLSLPLPLPWAVSLAVVSSLVLAPVQQPLFLALVTAHLLFFLPALGMVVAPCVANLWVASPFHSIFQLFQPLYFIPCIKSPLMKLSGGGYVFCTLPNTVLLSAK